MYLLDTNVVSELRRVKPHGAVVAWLSGVPETDLYLSAVTIGELQSGIEKMRSQNTGKAMEIELWLEQVSAAYNILSMDARAFRCWAQLMHGAQKVLAMDAMIAATALVHKLVVVTRNTVDFQYFSVATINPFEPARLEPLPNNTSRP